MTNRVTYLGATADSTYYMLVFRPSDRAIRDVVADEWDALDGSGDITAIGDCDIAQIATVGDAGVVQFTFPTLSAGLYGVQIREQAGGSPATDDAIQADGVGLVAWDGTQVLSVDGLALASVCTEGRLSELDITEIPADVLDVYTRLGAPAGASVSADIAAVKTDTGNLASRITGALFSGITSVADWLAAIAGKTPDATTQAEIRARTAGTTYTIADDSNEAIRDRGDAAWTGSPSGAHTLTLTVEDDGGNPLENMWVWLADAAGEVVSPAQRTNALGQIVWSLGNGDYYPNIAANASYTWDQTNYKVTISGASVTSTIVGTAFSAPSPSSAEYCVLYGYLQDGSGNVLASESRAVVVELENDYRNGNVGWEKEPLAADTNASGYFTLQVPRSIYLCSGSEASGSGTGTVKVRVGAKGLVVTGLTVPDAANKDFWDLVRGV